MADIYLLIEGKQEGPYAEEKVRQSLAEGLTPGDLPAWQEGLPDWVRVDSLFQPQKLQFSLVKQESLISAHHPQPDRPYRFDLNSYASLKLIPIWFWVSCGIILALYELITLIRVFIFADPSHLQAGSLSDNANSTLTVLYVIRCVIVLIIEALILFLMEVNDFFSRWNCITESEGEWMFLFNDWPFLGIAVASICWVLVYCFFWLRDLHAGFFWLSGLHAGASHELLSMLDTPLFLTLIIRAYWLVINSPAPTTTSVENRLPRTEFVWPRVMPQASGPMPTFKFGMKSGLIALVCTGLVAFALFDNPAPPSSTSSIVQALRQDNRLGQQFRSDIKAVKAENLSPDLYCDREAQLVEGLVTQMRSIDLSKCPPDFQQSYLNHAEAWYEFGDALTNHPHLTSDGEGVFGELLVTAVTQNAGELLDYMTNISQQNNDFIEVLKEKYHSVSLSWNNMQTIALSHGVKSTDYR